LVVVDRAKGALLGVQQATIALATVLGGEDMSFVHGANVKYEVPIRVELPRRTRLTWSRC